MTEIYIFSLHLMKLKSYSLQNLNILYFLEKKRSILKGRQIFLEWVLFLETVYPLLNPIALRMAKTPLSFGHSECHRVNQTKFHMGLLISYRILAAPGLLPSKTPPCSR